MSKLGNSVITDPADERKRVALSTFAVLSGAASYIILVFIALPLSVHLIINVNDQGCDVNIASDQCFAPTDESQRSFTLILTLLRTMTFVFGSLVGTISDKYGRRPLLILALLGYSTTAVMFLIGWATQTLALFFVGGIILGASSPITPHGIAYVSDISAPNKLAANLGILQGFGYFLGLMVGAMISLAVVSSTTGQDDAEDAGIVPYDKLFYASYGTGLAFSGASALATALFLPESLNELDRIDTIDPKRANPIGFLALVSRNPYILFVWLSLFFSYMAVGATEAVTGGWWLRRYVMTEVADFVVYIVLLWVASGLGSAIMTRVYVLTLGVKKTVHVSFIISIGVGVAFALAPNVPTSYISVGLSFFATAVYPATLAVIMGQVDVNEKGQLAGALRSSEALAKLIGIALFGNLFANYIEEFSPDQSCVPIGYSAPSTDPADGGASNNTNSCQCGVETCPTYDPTNPLSTNGFYYQPQECSLGQLSARFHGKPSSTIPWLGVAETRPIVPDAYVNGVAAGLVVRPDTCVGSGMTLNTKGFNAGVPRFWCLGEFAVADILAGTPVVNPANQFLGCPKFTFAGANPFVFGPTVNGNASATIWTTNVVTDEEDVCDEYGDAELNICLAGPIADFAGLFPILYLCVLTFVGYLCFVIAEVFFVKHDVRGWVEDTDGKDMAMVAVAEEA